MPRRAPEARPPSTEEIDVGWTAPQEAEAKTAAERSAARVGRTPKVEAPSLEQLVERAEKIHPERQKKAEPTVEERIGRHVRESKELEVKELNAKILAIGLELKNAPPDRRAKLQRELKALHDRQRTLKTAMESAATGVPAEIIEAGRRTAHEAAASKIREARRRQIMETEEYKKLMDEVEDIMTKAKAAKSEEELKERREEFDVLIRDLQNEAKTNQMGMGEAAKVLLGELNIEARRREMTLAESELEEKLFSPEGYTEPTQAAELKAAGAKIQREMEQRRAAISAEIDAELSKLDRQRERLAAEVQQRNADLEEARQGASLALGGRLRVFFGRAFKGLAPDAVRQAETQLAQVRAELALVANRMNELNSEEEIEERLKVSMAATGGAALSPERALRKAARDVRRGTVKGGGQPFGPTGELGRRE